jgi:hypothetical protein
VRLAEHEPLTRVHEPPGAKTTFPDGVIAPGPEESATIAVQLVAWFKTTLFGLQLTDVEVVRTVTVRANA